MARAFGWQPRGQGFDSPNLHKGPHKMWFFRYMQYSVYIIKSESNGRFYIGQTQDINQRLEFHNSGRSKYTKNLGPWALFATKNYDTRSDAVKWERKLKNLRSRRLILEFILKNKYQLY